MFRDDGSVVITSAYTVMPADPQRFKKGTAITVAYHHMRLGLYAKLHFAMSIDAFRREMVKCVLSKQPYVDLREVPRAE